MRKAVKRDRDNVASKQDPDVLTANAGPVRAAASLLLYFKLFQLVRLGERISLPLYQPQSPSAHLFESTYHAVPAGHPPATECYGLRVVPQDSRQLVGWCAPERDPVMQQPTALRGSCALHERPFFPTPLPFPAGLYPPVIMMPPRMPHPPLYRPGPPSMFHPYWSFPPGPTNAMPGSWQHWQPVAERLPGSLPPVSHGSHLPIPITLPDPRVFSPDTVSYRNRIPAATAPQPEAPVPVTPVEQGPAERDVEAAAALAAPKPPRRTQYICAACGKLKKGHFCAVRYAPAPT